MFNQFGVKPQFIAGLKRDRTQGDFPADALDVVFRTAKDQAGSAEGTSSQWIVFRVTGITQGGLGFDRREAHSIRSGQRLFGDYARSNS